jgi:ABC-type transporter Mla subunit MlaD
MRAVFMAIVISSLLGCQGGRTIRVRFDTADNVKPGAVVLLHDERVGAVKRVRTDGADESAVLTILFDEAPEIPAGSAFTLYYDNFGTPFISIGPSDDVRMLDRKLIQQGRVN